MQHSQTLWMEDNQIKTLSWPTQTPDLNLIENLWNVIKRKDTMSQLNFCGRSGIKSPNSNVTDW